MPDDTDLNTVELATELTVAWLGNANTRVSAEDIPAFLTKMHETVSGLAGGGAAPAKQAEASNFMPAVSARMSLASPDHIISMIDGKPYKTLRRHLATNGLSPDEYRQRYGLKADYPMTASSYSEARRAMAKTIGLGRKPKQTGNELAQPQAAPATDAKPGRKPRATKTSS